MNFGLNEEQQILRDSAHGFFAKECPGTFVREMAEDEKGYTSELWQKMAELGYMGVLFPEQYGGYEGSFLDLAVLLYEMGYVSLPGPYFSTVVHGAITLLEAGNETQKGEILPEVASGEEILTLAWTETGGSYAAQEISLKAELRNDHYVLTGTKLFVPDAHVADKIICVARTQEPTGDYEEGVSLFIVKRENPGLTVQVHSTLAGDKQCEVDFDQVEVPAENLLGELHRGWPILKKVLQKASVAKCAQMIGGGQRAIDLTVPYLKEREQFGRPVGSFQAVKHHCANILTLHDTSKFMTFQAAWRISEGLSFEKEASMCKAWVSDSYRQLVALAHQVMGGIGFMEEHDLQLYFKQAKAGELAFGDARFHRELVAQQMGL
ncbi:MAG: acyl-CoA dehydrogenase family protein [Pseudomonadota bacterium]